MIPSLESIDWQMFLRRPPISTEASRSISSLTKQCVLITGAGGSIGSALALRLAADGIKTILLESSEGALCDLQFELAVSGPFNRATFYLGNADNRELLSEIFTVHQPQTVFHAAAFKHVPLLEEQPFAAMENNIFGTEVLVEASAKHHARTVLLSTDKAVSPSSVMGATKRVTEQIVLGSKGIVVRLGNVLASRGSVAEVFAAQIRAGKPLTVTHPAARRYFLTIAEAVDSLIVASSAPRATLLIPRLREAYSIRDLAQFMVAVLVPQCEISIEYIGLRAGDKLNEEFWSPDEMVHEQRGDLLRVESQVPSRHELDIQVGRMRSAARSRDLINAISALRVLVPDYVPSETLLSTMPIHHD